MSAMYGTVKNSPVHKNSSMLVIIRSTHHHHLGHITRVWLPQTCQGGTKHGTCHLLQLSWRCYHWLWLWSRKFLLAIFNHETYIHMDSPFIQELFLHSPDSLKGITWHMVDEDMNSASVVGVMISSISRSPHNQVISPITIDITSTCWPTKTFSYLK